eukprot:TRINITY_DN100297_c0_g1_i1.p1 TRINITY_DN100297_c0_g1~~TRINITY_DN100297_c0_g1_i1.p1  ORF type:complete len:123 (-),score=14.01 TRINITY_DN100297_c0_g1_i1:310-678(-)
MAPGSWPPIAYAGRNGKVPYDQKDDISYYFAEPDEKVDAKVQTDQCHRRFDSGKHTLNPDSRFYLPGYGQVLHIAKDCRGLDCLKTILKEYRICKFCQSRCQAVVNSFIIEAINGSSSSSAH